MTDYAGLDVSLEETVICIVHDTGRIVKEVRCASEPQALIARGTMSACQWTASGLKRAR